MGLPRPDAGTPVHDYLAQHWSRKVILNWPCVDRERIHALADFVGGGIQVVDDLLVRITGSSPTMPPDATSANSPHS